MKEIENAENIEGWTNMLSAYVRGNEALEQQLQKRQEVITGDAYIVGHL